MIDKRNKLKNRKSIGTFIQIPHAVMDSTNWHQLTGNALKLLLTISRAYNGANNGDLSAAFSQLKKRGWRSQNTLNICLKELIHYGFIIKTRQGDLTKKPSLYALTWHAIDNAKGKLELCSATTKSPGNWKYAVAKFDRSKIVRLKTKKKKLKERKINLMSEQDIRQVHS